MKKCRKKKLIMLCSHDGDPVYQELGEALYCWFLSAVRKTATELALR